jgi:hypothetical protein
MTRTGTGFWGRKKRGLFFFAFIQPELCVVVFQVHAL